MDDNLIKLDARLGALEILTRNLYADRFAREPDPVAAASRAVMEIERLSRGIRVKGDDPETNERLAAEAADFLTSMFHEIVEIMRQKDCAGGGTNAADAAPQETEPWRTSRFPPQALTPDWLAAALGAPVTDCVVSPLGASSGVLGQIAQVAVSADGANVPSSLVVKLPPAHEEARGLATMLRLFQREHGFYADLSAAAPIAAPRCHAAPWDAESGLGALALEDLSALRRGDLRTGYTLAEASAVLAALARLHGAFWQSEQLGAAWLPAWNDAGIGALVRGAYDQVWPACRQHFAAVLPDTVAAFGDGLAARLPTLAEELAAAPVTLLHGDCRLDNVLFRDDDGPQPVFIDWQLVASGRPALDVAYFLTQSGDPEQLAANEAALLDAYHAALVASGANAYDRAALDADYRRAVVQSFIYPVLAVGSIDPNVAGQVEMAGVALHRAATAVLRLGLA